MKILIAGGTGFTGKFLSDRFVANGHKVSFVSRSKGHIKWSLPELTDALNNTDVLINLSGKNINCRQSKANKQAILSSRVDTTNKLGEAILNCKTPPTLWINASASAIYGNTAELPATEQKFVTSNSFLSDVVQQWEDTFFSIKPKFTRQVALRSSVILGNSGGAFQELNKLAKLGLGGKAGSGNQLLSWIHIEDFYRIVEFVISNTHISGIVNTTSPLPVTNKQFMQVLRKSNNCYIGIPTPAFALKILEKITDLNASLILDSVNFIPEKLLNAGFNFKFTEVNSAIKNLIEENEKGIKI